MYLRQRDFRAAIDTLKVFDKVDTKVASHASTNLAFLFFLVSGLGERLGQWKRG